MTKRIIFIIFAIVFLMGESSVFAQSETGFLKRKITVNGTEYGYRIYIPQNFNPRKKYPVVLFLHGSDERGKSNESQIESGLAQVVRIGERLGIKAFSEFIAVFPQCRADNFWIGEQADQAVAAFDQMVSEFKADSKRLYVTGFSLGGYGAWYIAAKHPKKFAAIAPIGGHIVPAFLTVPITFPAPIKALVHPELLPLYESNNPYLAVAKEVGRTPVWMFHGGEDEQVPITDARKMAEALKEAGASYQFTEYAGNRHFIYDKAYTEKGFWSWLFSKKLSN
jgi:predicted peptidase